jgi:hypothetical protein
MWYILQGACHPEEHQDGKEEEEELHWELYLAA